MEKKILHEESMFFPSFVKIRKKKGSYACEEKLTNSSDRYNFAIRF